MQLKQKWSLTDSHCQQNLLIQQYFPVAVYSLWLGYTRKCAACLAVRISNGIPTCLETFPSNYVFSVSIVVVVFHISVFIFIYLNCKLGKDHRAHNYGTCSVLYAHKCSYDWLSSGNVCCKLQVFIGFCLPDVPLYTSSSVGIVTPCWITS